MGDNSDQRTIVEVVILQRKTSERGRMLANLLKFFFGDSIEVSRRWLSVEDETRPFEALRKDVTYFHVYESDRDVNVLINIYGVHAPIIPFIWTPEYLGGLANKLYVRGPIHAYWAVNGSIPLEERLKIMVEILAVTLGLNMPGEDKIGDYVNKINKRYFS